MINDMYHLDCTGSVYHDAKLVDYDFFVDNIDDADQWGEQATNETI